MSKEEAAAATSENESDEDWGDVDQTPTKTQKSSQGKAKKRKPEPEDESEDCEDTEEEAEETAGSTDEGSETEVEEEKPPPKAKPPAPKKRKAEAPKPKKAPAAKPNKASGKPKETAPDSDLSLATQSPASKAPRKPPAPKGPTVFAETPLTKVDGKYVREGMSAEQEMATYKEAMQAQDDDWKKKLAKATTLATNGRNKNPKSTVQAFNGVDGAILSTAAQELYAQEQADKREPTPIELLQEAALKFAKATGVTPTVTVNLTGSPRAL